MLAKYILSIFVGVFLFCFLAASNELLGHKLSVRVCTCKEEGVGRTGKRADLCTSTLGAGQLGTGCWLPIGQTLHCL